MATAFPMKIAYRMTHASKLPGQRVDMFYKKKNSLPQAVSLISRWIQCLSCCGIDSVICRTAYFLLRVAKIVSTRSPLIYLGNFFTSGFCNFERTPNITDFQCMLGSTLILSTSLASLLVHAHGFLSIKATNHSYCYNF